MGTLLAGVAAAIMAAPLNDNSFLTHLATGRLILDRGSVPHSDPYSFTAGGEPWVVQSWIASWLYATLEAIGGLGLVRLSFALTGAVLMALAWALLRPAESLIVRLAIAGLFLCIGATVWSERPLMLGLIGFALVALSSEGRLAPGWLAPVGWIWANSHGSFPLAFVFLLARWFGARLDGEAARDEERSAAWLLVGTLAGVVGPLGLDVIRFPIQLLRRQDLLRHVIEWQSPAFTSLGDRLFLVLVVLAILGIVRSGRYRDAVPSLAFVVAALLGARNVPVAALVLLSPVARAVPALGSLRSGGQLRAPRFAVLSAALLSTMLLAARMGDRDLDLRAYPIASLGYLEAENVDIRDRRLAARETVGNLLTYVYGANGAVFADDRFDMYPREVSRAALALNFGTPPLLSELDDLGIELVLSPTVSATSSVLARDAEWRVLFVEDQWQLACRRSSDLPVAAC